jgi:hypothetical protein
VRVFFPHREHRDLSHPRPHPSAAARLPRTSKRLTLT